MHTAYANAIQVALVEPNNGTPVITHRLLWKLRSIFEKWSSFLHRITPKSEAETALPTVFDINITAGYRTVVDEVPFGLHTSLEGR